MQIDKNDFCRCLLDSFIITVFLLSFSLSGISDRLWLLGTATVFLLSLTSLAMRLVVFFLCLCLSSGGGVNEDWFWSLFWLLLLIVIIIKVNFFKKNLSPVIILLCHMNHNDLLWIIFKTFWWHIFWVFCIGLTQGS